MSGQWYISRQGSRHGPYTWEEVVHYGSDGAIDPEDMIWGGPTGGWVSAAQVPGLLPAGTASASRASAARPRSLRRKKIALITVATIMALLVVVIYFAFIKTPNVEVVARKVEKALLASDGKALENLTYPTQRAVMRTWLETSSGDMPKIGESFANRRLIAREDNWVLYEVTVEGNAFMVEFILLDRSWWLWLQ